MNLPQRLADLALKITPGSRRGWAQAMRAEVAHGPARQDLAFAAGGLLMAVRFRAAHGPSVLATARYGLAAAALVWAGLHLRLAGGMGEEASLPRLLETVTATLFGVGGVLTALFGLRATVLLGAPLLALVGVYAAGAGLLMPDSPNRDWYLALAVEDFAALLLAVTLAVAARRYGRRRA